MSKSIPSCVDCDQDAPNHECVACNGPLCDSCNEDHHNTCLACFFHVAFDESEEDLSDLSGVDQAEIEEVLQNMAEEIDNADL